MSGRRKGPNAWPSKMQTKQASKLVAVAGFSLFPLSLVFSAVLFFSFFFYLFSFFSHPPSRLRCFQHTLTHSLFGPSLSHLISSAVISLSLSLSLSPFLFFPSRTMWPPRLASPLTSLSRSPPLLLSRCFSLHFASPSAISLSRAPSFVRVFVHALLAKNTELANKKTKTKKLGPRSSGCDQK